MEALVTIPSFGLGYLPMHPFYLYPARLTPVTPSLPHQISPHEWGHLPREACKTFSAPPCPLFRSCPLVTCLVLPFPCADVAGIERLWGRFVDAMQLRPWRARRLIPART